MSIGKNSLKIYLKNRLSYLDNEIFSLGIKIKSRRAEKEMMELVKNKFFGDVKWE